MSENGGLKLTYNPSQLRVRLEADASDFRRISTLPNDLKERAQNRLSAEKISGAIVDVATTFNSFEKFFSKINSSACSYIPDEHKFVINLAIGISPIVEQFRIKNEGSGVFYLSLEGSSEKIRDLSFFTFTVYLRHILKPFNLTVDPAQIAVLYGQAIQGEGIIEEALLPWQRLGNRERRDGVPYTCFFNDHLQALILRVFDMKPLLSEEGRQSALNWLASQAAKHNELTFCESFLLERLESAACGIESVGINLPFDVLAALRKKVQGEVSSRGWGTPISASFRNKAPPGLAQQGSAALTPPPPPLSPPYPGAGLLQVEVSSDAMTARIVSFKTSFYKQATLDEGWLKKELERLKIKSISADQYKKAVDILMHQEDLNSLQIATGSYGRAGSMPYIAEVKRDTDTDAEQVDHRKVRPQLMVKAGEKVACVAYELDEEPGRDVYGRVLLPLVPETGELSIGPGLELREGRYFYAQHDGILQIQRKAIELSRALIHAGDVNLASGDIDFDGPVFIQGSIDTGASVRSTGNLNVQGSIRGGHVYCGGNLEVKAGINSTNRGFIFCRGNVQTGFIESSIIVCIGNLHAQKAVLNSTLFVEGNLVVASQHAVLAGGDLYVWGDLSSTDIGLSSGIDTNIHLGCNWRWARQVDSNKRRLQNFENLRERIKKEWQELKNKPQTTMSAQKKDVLKNYQVKLEKLQKIIDRCMANLQRLKRDRPFNKKSRALIKGKIQPRCYFYADSKKIKVPENIQGVAVLAFSNEGDGAVRALD